MTPRELREAAIEGGKMGLREGLADLSSRIFIAGALIGASGAVGGLLSVGGVGAEFIDKAAGLCVASGVIGALLFSLPNRQNVDRDC